ncbi:MAG: DUF1553 domain-containing protein, partial [Planctomycetota bacterium]
EDLASTVAQIDRHRSDRLATADMPSAPMADWMTICRRLSLALVGNQMSLEEIRELEQFPESERESVHLSNLLDDARFHHYWAERWTRFLVGTDGGEFLVYRRRRFRVWLSEVFADQWRYDQLVRTLVTAEGLWTDRPEVNFYTATFDSGDGKPDVVRLAARTSRVFLGLRIDCLQCHDDFLGNVALGDCVDPRPGQQADFHQLASFYSAATTNGLQGIRAKEADYRYKYLDAEEEVDVAPSVPYSPELLPETGDARERLAAWLTHPQNRQAARSAVNHVWALMFGRPLGQGVDNIPLDSDRHPLIDRLADAFIASEYNLQDLIRVIALSDPFSVESRADYQVTESHDLVGAVFPLVRLRPEQVAGSVVQSSRVKTVDRDSAFLVQLLKFGQSNEFVQRYGDMGEDEFSSESVTVTQRLLMLNGKMLNESTELNPVLNASAHVNMFSANDPKAVESIFLSVLNRYPTDEESAEWTTRFAAGDRGNHIEDLCWVLLNSSEFSWNH